MLRSLFLLLLGAFGGAALSQGPVFADRYAQTLSGRLEELNQSIVAVERDIAANIRSEGAAASLMARRDRLDAHSRRLLAAPDELRLIEVFSSYDREVADSALFEFRPSAPTTLSAFAHGVVGFLFGRAIGWLMLSALGNVARRSVG